MAPFQTKEEFVGVFSTLWDRITGDPEIAKPLASTGLLARFRFRDFGTDLYIDATGDRLTYYWDPNDGATPDVDMILSSEVGHRFWMKDLNVPLAIASRKIVAQGSVQKALKLLPALRPAFALYPEVLREIGRADLVARPERRAARRRFSLFGRRRPARYDLAALPEFPMTFRKGAPPAIARGDATDAPPVSDVGLLRTMYRIRLFEEHLGEAFRAGELPTEAIHLSIGQEGVAAGVCMNLRDTDYLNTTHRGHGHLIAKGADVNRMMAEIYGRSAGLCGGKGGSMHAADGARSILGANGIVGAGYLLALGAGFTIKHEGRDDLSVVIAGDGSVNQGMFHEAANMIGLFGLPVLMVIENNLYGEFTPIERHSAVPEIHRRAAAYGIESRRLDGNDAKGLYAAMREIVADMRADGRPRLVECMTYRWRGHMEGEPELYRRAEEKAEFQAADPIARLEAGIAGGEPGGKDKADAAKAQAEQEIRDAVAFALGAASPEPTALTVDVYTPEDPSLFTGGFDALDRADARREISVSQAINEAIGEEMAADDGVFLWGEDVTLGGYFNVTEGLVARFGPGRIIDTPISENAIVGGAVGAAITGMRPIAEILFGDFLTCCMDPLLNQAAKLRYMTGGQVSVPLTIRTPVGSGVGMAAQHSQSMERFFFGVPGLIVVAPCDAYTAKGLLKSAIRSDNPVLFFEHKLLYATSGEVPDGEYRLPLGKARVVRSGRDVTVTAHLLGVSVALDAAALLEAQGVSVEVIDLATLYPMDTETVLESLAKTRRLATLEEGGGTGGIGAEVIARTATAGLGVLKAPPLRIAAPECPVPYAKALENVMLLDPQDVAERVLSLLR